VETGITNTLARASTWGLWQLFGASKFVLAFSLLAGLTAGGSSAGLMAFINRSFAEEQKSSAALAPAFFGLCFLALFSGALSVTLLSRIAQENLYKLRLWLIRRILCTPLQYLQSCGPHRLMAALTDDVGSVVNAQQILPSLFIDGTKLVAAFFYLGYLSPSLLGLVLIFVVFGVTTYRLPQERALRLFGLARETGNTLFGHFRAVTEGHKELKMDALRRRAFLDEELSKTADIYRRQQNRALLILVLANNWSDSLYYLLIGTVLFLAPLAEQIPRETLTGFTLAIFFIGGPLSGIFNAVPALGRGIVALKNIEALGIGMVAEPEVGTAVDPCVYAAMPSTIELFAVSYRHQNENEETGYQVGPLDLRISPGELVFVTGGNGSGKTTLALLILGLYPPDEGEIRIGGRLVTNLNRDAYRQNFSAIFADSYVFDSLLGYSGPKLQARAEELLVLLQLDRKLHIENGRFSTVDLSRGQRKRMALLAAYLADRPFYLFDEWAADQDPLFRDIFYQEMLPELKARGKTVIVITHDDRYFHLSDRIFCMSMGRIEEFQPGSVSQNRRTEEAPSHV
jgi:putative ATP-binding cassette transporter